MKIPAIFVLLITADFTVSVMFIDNINITNIDPKVGKVNVTYVNTPAGVVMSLILEYFQQVDTMSMSLTLRRTDDDVKPGVFNPNLYTKPLFKHQLDISELVDGKKGNFLTSSIGGAMLKMFDPPVKFPLQPGTYKFDNFILPSPIQFKLFYYNQLKFFGSVKDNPKKLLFCEWHIFGRNT